MVIRSLLPLCVIKMDKSLKMVLYYVVLRDKPSSILIMIIMTVKGPM